jgi:hypothetical protein
MCHCFGVLGEAVASPSAGQIALLDGGSSSSGTVSEEGVGRSNFKIGPGDPMNVEIASMANFEL